MRHRAKPVTIAALTRFLQYTLQRRVGQDTGSAGAYWHVLCRTSWDSERLYCLLHTFHGNDNIGLLYDAVLE
jgi:hypothetical protein